MAWANIEIPVCSRICFDVNTVISEATSRSNRLLRAASAFSMFVAKFAAAKPSRLCAPPTFARAVFNVVTAASMAVDAALAFVASAPVTEVALRAKDVVVIWLNVTVMVSSVVVLGPT